MSLPFQTTPSQVSLLQSGPFPSCVHATHSCSLLVTNSLAWNAPPSAVVPGEMQNAGSETLSAAAPLGTRASQEPELMASSPRSASCSLLFSTHPLCPWTLPVVFKAPSQHEASPALVLLGAATRHLPPASPKKRCHSACHHLFPVLCSRRPVTSDVSSSPALLLLPHSQPVSAMNHPNTRSSLQ